jgi:predicted ester cyclase
MATTASDAGRGRQVSTAAAPVARHAQPIAHDQKGTVMSNASNAALTGPWQDLWNGDLSVTDKIIAEDFVAHAAPITGSGPDRVRGREALNAWVSGIRAILPDLSFVLDVGPITDDEHLVVRWKARGTYRSGFPGASSEAVGREVAFTGTDTLRIADGMLAEYWANADSLLFVQQLGVREVPAYKQEG